MTREEKLRDVARALYEVAEQEKAVKKQREQLKQDLYRLIDYDFRGKDYLLPIRTVEVPNSFFSNTGMSYDSFVKSRMPGWTIEHVEKNTQTEITTFVFKKDPSYVSRVVEVDTDKGKIVVSKEVSEFEPGIDWETLALDDLDLYNKLAKEVYSVEMNEDAFQELMETEPEFLGVLQRHMVVRQPTIRAVPRLKKDE